MTAETPAALNAIVYAQRNAILAAHAYVDMPLKSDPLPRRPVLNAAACEIALAEVWTDQRKAEHTKRGHHADRKAEIAEAGEKSGTARFDNSEARHQERAVVILHIVYRTPKTSAQILADGGMKPGTMEKTLRRMVDEGLLNAEFSLIGRSRQYLYFAPDTPAALIRPGASKYSQRCHAVVHAVRGAGLTSSGIAKAVGLSRSVVAALLSSMVAGKLLIRSKPTGADRARTSGAPLYSAMDAIAATRGAKNGLAPMAARVGSVGGIV